MVRIAWRSVAKGVGSFVLPSLRSTHQPNGTVTAEHCYGLCMRHYSHLARWLPPGGAPKVLLELGPGSSLGTGLAAILLGVEQYIALDVQDHRNTEHDIEVLRELVGLFAARTVVRDGTDGEIVFPLPLTKIPGDDLDPVLARTLEPAFIEQLVDDLRKDRGERLRFVAPWWNTEKIAPSSVDWLMTHSVMEHVDDLESTYASFAKWVRPGGYMTHLIDFDAHTLASPWNGHWAIGDLTWKMMRGRRPYLLNRKWRSVHLELLRANGFDVVDEMCHEPTGGLTPRALAPPFRQMSEEDAKVRMTFIVARRRMEDDRRRPQNVDLVTEKVELTELGGALS